jgi:hypothetical protein
MKDHGDNKKSKKDKKEETRDLDRHDGNAAKAQSAGDQRHDQKYQSPSQHFFSFFCENLMCRETNARSGERFPTLPCLVF